MNTFLVFDSRYVRPSLAVANQAACGFVHPEVTSDLAESRPRPPHSYYSHDLAFVKFRHTMDCALAVVSPALRLHVKHVILIAAQCQVFRVDAGRIVALMHNNLVARRAFAAYEFIGEPMGVF